MSLLQDWLTIHRKVSWAIEPPLKLVRLHVTLLPDEVECSLDGHAWGVLRTEERRRTRLGLAGSGTYVARMFRQREGQDHPKRDTAVGSHMDEYVFIRLETFEMLSGLGGEAVKP